MNDSAYIGTQLALLWWEQSGGRKHKLTSFYMNITWSSTHCNWREQKNFDGTNNFIEILTQKGGFIKRDFQDYFLSTKSFLQYFTARLTLNIDAKAQKRILLHVSIAQFNSDFTSHLMARTNLGKGKCLLGLLRIHHSSFFLPSSALLSVFTFFPLLYLIYHLLW